MRLMEAEGLSKAALRNAVRIKHPLTLRQLTNRFDYVVTYQLSKGRFRELYRSYMNEFDSKPGLVAGSRHRDHDGPSRAFAWCGENGERAMMVCDGSADYDESVIYLGFTNFAQIPDLACKYWKPIQMKSDSQGNPWGILLQDLVQVETVSPPEPEPVVKQGFWARLFNWKGTSRV